MVRRRELIKPMPIFAQCTDNRNGRKQEMFQMFGGVPAVAGAFAIISSRKGGYVQFYPAKGRSQVGQNDCFVGRELVLDFHFGGVLNNRLPYFFTWIGPSSVTKIGDFLKKPTGRFIFI
jgi:hypothetical protein